MIHSKFLVVVVVVVVVVVRGGWSMGVSRGKVILEVVKNKKEKRKFRP